MLPMTKIPIDFVAGTHGHFLEVVLNKFFQVMDVTFDPFTELGTSHVGTPEFHATKIFDADHWFEYRQQELDHYPLVISIQFTQQDLLLVSSLSLLRAGDMNIHNDSLEYDTVKKLDNKHYKHTLQQIQSVYPFVQGLDSIPRNVLREFYKLGFANPEQNGYWVKQCSMRYNRSRVFKINLQTLYNIDQFELAISELSKILNQPFDFCKEFYTYHQTFVSKIQFLDHYTQCQNIIHDIQQERDCAIPKLTLFQESYINSQLENFYHKEMPFHQDKYFTSTKDVLYYIDTSAPNL